MQLDSFSFGPVRGAGLSPHGASAPAPTRLAEARPRPEGRPTRERPLRALQSRAGACLAALLVSSVAAFAHPMGNFSVSHYSRLAVSADAVHMDYVLDLAEIPTFQELQAVGASPERLPAGAELQAYAQRKAQEWLANLELRRSGVPSQWRLLSAQAEFAEGAGGLPTMKVHLKAESPGSVGASEIWYHDGNFPGRAGWKEIVVASSGVALAGAEGLAADLSSGLAAYPSDPLANPPQVLEASFRVVGSQGPIAPVQTSGLGGPSSLLTSAPGTAASRVAVLQTATSQSPADYVTPAPGGAPATASTAASSLLALPSSSASSSPAKSRPAAAASSTFSEASGKFQWGNVTRGDFLSQIISGRELGWRLILLAMGAAFCLGAFHALSPGHGKTIVAAYLVGTRGTIKHALFLGGIVTFTHTMGVFALGVVVLLAGPKLVPERLYPWLGVGCGLSIVAIGVTMFRKRLAALAGHHHGHTHGHGHDHSHDHVHGHDHTHSHAHSHDHVHNHAGHSHEHEHSHDLEHDHDHDHAHGHHHGHSHEIPEKVTFGNLLALGVSGGIIPCPSALVVLLAAISLNRAALGVLLILAFSLGLAVVLSSIGITMVQARSLFDRLPVNSGFVRRLPVLSSAVVSVLGLGIALQALMTVLPHR